MPVVFDFEGCGQEGRSPEAVSAEIEARMGSNGWSQERICAIAITPELENWIWGVDVAHLHTAFSWKSETPVDEWLRRGGWWDQQESKPERPKEALQAALRFTGKPWSSSIHGYIGQHASWKRCMDPAFNKMIKAIKGWFPILK